MKELNDEDCKEEEKETVVREEVKKEQMEDKEVKEETRF